MIYTKVKLNEELKKYSIYEINNISSNHITIAKSKQDIIKFVNKELKIKSDNNKIYLGKVSDYISNIIKKSYGLNIKNYNISLKADSVRKIMKSHGCDKREQQRGQIAVMPKDFSYIDDIVVSPDKIILSDRTYNDKPVIIFEKILENKYTLVEVISDKKCNLEVQTLYIHKKKNPAPESHV